MVRENILAKSFKFILKEIVLDFLYWPIWWYTKGAKLRLLKMFDFIKQGSEELSLHIWLKNIFVPMYGQYDWQSRLISFFMRFFQIIIRFIIFIFWILLAIIIFLFWLIIPVFIVLQLLLNFGLFKNIL